MIKLAIIGTGGMGHSHAERFGSLKDCVLVAACDVDAARVEDFVAEFSIPSGYTNADTMLAKEELDAVVIVTPDGAHRALGLKALDAGKHVLCEKPLALNYSDAREMADAAEKSGRINMVNFSYRRSPAVQAAREMVRSGQLGRLLHFSAHYLQSWLVSDMWGDWRTESQWLWRLSKGHGSQGVLGDIGVHILDFVSYPAGEIHEVQCRLKTFHKAPDDRIGDYSLDANDSALVQVELDNGALGVVHMSRWATGYRNALALTLHGDRGALRLDLECDDSLLEVCLGDDIDTGTWREKPCPPTPDNAERFLESIRTGKNDQPDFARGAAIQQVLDACFASDAAGKAVPVG